MKLRDISRAGWMIICIAITLVLIPSVSVATGLLIRESVLHAPGSRMRGDLSPVGS